MYKDISFSSIDRRLLLAAAKPTAGCPGFLAGSATSSRLASSFRACVTSLSSSGSSIHQTVLGSRNSATRRSLSEALGHRPLPVLQLMEWNSGRAAYVRHLASTLYRQLHALHGPKWMSVRALQPTGSGSDQLWKDISKLRGVLLSFYGFADALRRGN